MKRLSMNELLWPHMHRLIYWSRYHFPGAQKVGSGIQITRLQIERDTFLNENQCYQNRRAWILGT